MSDKTQAEETLDEAPSLPTNDGEKVYAEETVGDRAEGKGASVEYTDTGMTATFPDGSQIVSDHGHINTK